jgi:hypothetical protein
LLKGDQRPRTGTVKEKLWSILILLGFIIGLLRLRMRMMDEDLL